MKNWHTSFPSRRQKSAVKLPQAAVDEMLAKEQADREEADRQLHYLSPKCRKVPILGPNEKLSESPAENLQPKP